MGSNKKKVIKYLAKIIAVILASVYLVFIVDVYTLNTMLKRVFVFGYFLIICGILVYLKERFMKGRNSMRVAALSAVIAVVILAVFQSVFLPAARSNTITLQAGETGEVWLVDIDADGKNIPLSQLEITGNYNWEYSAAYDDYVFYPNKSFSGNGLIFDIGGSAIKLNFAANSWSGAVSVTDTDGNLEVLDLYTDEGDETEHIEYLCGSVHNYSGVERVVYNLGAWSILAFALQFIVGFFVKK